MDIFSRVFRCVVALIDVIDSKSARDTLHLLEIHTLFFSQLSLNLTIKNYP